MRLDDLERSLLTSMILLAPLKITVILGSPLLKENVFLGLTLGNELPQELRTNKDLATFHMTYKACTFDLAHLNTYTTKCVRRY